MSKQNLFLAFICLCSIGVVHAEAVQRWQDSSGQWHFGDQAAALGKRSKPVLIKNPISVVKNDQPVTVLNAKTNKQSKARQPKTTRSAKTNKQPNSSANAQHKQKCDTLREQVYRQPISGKASQVRQNLVQQYEQNCIAGNYYGD